MVEAGNLKPVTITWAPPPGHDVCIYVRTISVKFRGRQPETYDNNIDATSLSWCIHTLEFTLEQFVINSRETI